MARLEGRMLHPKLMGAPAIAECRPAMSRAVNDVLSTLQAGRILLNVRALGHSSLSI